MVWFVLKVDVVVNVDFKVDAVEVVVNVEVVGRNCCWQDLFCKTN